MAVAGRDRFQDGTRYEGTAMDPSLPLHVRFRAWVLKKMAPMHPGEMLPPARKLADRFGVCVLTAHKVLSDLQKEGLIQRRKGKGTFISAREGEVRSEPRAGRRGRLVVVYPHWFSHDIWTKVDLAQHLAAQEQWEVTDYKVMPETTYEALSRFVADIGRVQGVVLIPPGGQITRQEMRTLDGLGVPVVTLVTSPYTSLTCNVFSVAKDAFKAGYLMAEHLLERGHRRIGYVANEPPHEDSELLLTGIKGALRDRRVPRKGLRRSSERTRPYESSMAAGHRLTAGLLRGERPTALLFDSVPGAIGGMRAIREAGLSVPGDVSVVVNDEYDRYEEFLNPPLTTVAMDRREMLTKALALIADRGSSQKVCTVDVRLIERESVAAPGRTATCSRRDGNKGEDGR
jgi:DNA-binding LacI/PurR family transcriptional regulator